MIKTTTSQLLHHGSRPGYRQLNLQHQLDKIRTISQEDGHSIKNHVEELRWEDSIPSKLKTSG
eukprot:2699389-Amphidinium_carterae.1